MTNARGTSEGTSQEAGTERARSAIRAARQEDVPNHPPPKTHVFATNATRSFWLVGLNTARLLPTQNPLRPHEVAPGATSCGSLFYYTLQPSSACRFDISTRDRKEMETAQEGQRRSAFGKKR